MNEPKPQHFAGSHAAAYDAARAPFAAVNDALYMCADAALSSLPDDARVLCVGAGTGGELIHLARSHATWTFAVVEPSLDMMALCREKAAAAGVDGRCTFFEGYVEAVPEAAGFDAALCLLVSYFLLDPGERMALFEAIGKRLRGDGLLVNAELVGDMSAPAYVTLRDAWVAMYHSAGIKMNPDYLGRDVAVSPVADIEAMLSRAGFLASTVVFQALLICAWSSRKASTPGRRDV